MNHSTILILPLALCILVACSADSDDQSVASPTPAPPEAPQTPTVTPAPTPVESREEKELALVGEIETFLDEDRCEATPENCEFVEYIYHPQSELEISSSKKREYKYQDSGILPSSNILILDSGIYPLALTGYRNRVTALYQLTEQMSFETYQPSLRMPSTLNEVFKLIADYDDFISVQKFQNLITHPNLAFLFSEINGELNNSFGHGYFIGSFIFEHNPRAGIVLSEHRGRDVNLITPAQACLDIISSDQETNDRALELIQAQHDSYLQSIKTLVDRHQIDYINASWGYSGPIIDRQIALVCDGNASDYIRSQILDIDRQFMKGLSELFYADNDGVIHQTILVQAGAVAATSTLVESAPEFPADCDSSMQNRVRVSAIDNDGIADVIPQFGTSDDLFIKPETALRYKACTDIYLPVGTYSDSSIGIPLPATRYKSLNTIFHGLIESNSFPGLRSSSFAPPIVISAFNHIQSSYDEHLSLAELMVLLTEGNLIIDPLLYDQFNVYEWEYRER